MSVTHTIGLRVTYEGFLIPSGNAESRGVVKLTLKDRLRLLCGSPLILRFVGFATDNDTFNRDAVLKICMPERDEISRAVANEMLDRGLVFTPKALAKIEEAQ